MYSQSMDRLGRWEIVKCLGALPHFEWFEAVASESEGCRAPGGRVVLQCYELGDPWADMFADEVGYLATAFDHPSILRAFRWERDGSRQWVVLEYAEGFSLNRLLQLSGPLAPASAAAIGRQLCEAVEHVHSLRNAQGQPLNAIHRNLSLDMVWVEPSGRLRSVNPALAVPLGMVSKASHDQRSWVFGTVSPEMAAGRRCEAASDLFQVAAITCALVTGRPPFCRESDLETLRATSAADLSAVRKRLEQVPPVLREALLRSLERAPERRHPNAHELAVGLHLAETAEGLDDGPANLRAAVARVAEQEPPSVCGVPPPAIVAFNARGSASDQRSRGGTTGSGTS